MKLAIKIDVDGSTCGEHCPFKHRRFKYEHCKLFGMDLSETTLPDNHVWNTNTSPTSERCTQCLLFDE